MNKHYRVVFQLSQEDPSLHKAAITQIKNTLNALGNVSIELVTHGGGVDLLKNDTPYLKGLTDLKNHGVSLLACHNALQFRGLTLKDLMAGAEVIPSAVAHIIVRQSEGWSYLKIS